MSLKFDIFVKQVSKKDNSGTFPVYSTKNDNGVKFRVVFTSDVPTNIYKNFTKPFTVEVPENKVNAAQKYRVNKEGAKIPEFVLYIEAVTSVADYVRPDFSMDAFNSYKRDENVEYEELISDEDIDRENDLPY